MNIKILHFGSKAQDREDSRNHGLQDPHGTMWSVGPALKLVILDPVGAPRDGLPRLVLVHVPRTRCLGAATSAVNSGCPLSPDVPWSRQTGAGTWQSWATLSTTSFCWRLPLICDVR